MPDLGGSDAAVDNDFIGEVTRRQAAATTLADINTACVSGIPSQGIFLAANTVIEAYLTGRALPSPMTTGGHDEPC